MGPIGHPIDGYLWSRIKDFAATVAVLPVHHFNGGTVADYRRIGDLANQYANEIFTDRLMHDPSREIDLAVATGWLLYALEYHGLNFEDLSRGAGLTLARAVAAVSGDPRLPFIRRVTYVASAACEAETSTQVALLAEITARVERLHDDLTQAYDPDLREWVESWLGGKQTLLSHLANQPKLMNSPPILQTAMAMKGLYQRVRVDNTKPVTKQTSKLVLPQTVPALMALS